MAKNAGGAHSMNMVRGIKERVKQLLLRESELSRKADELGFIIYRDSSGIVIRHEVAGKEK
ncbi:MAG: hypothetical protein ACYC38_02820 [Eubacteriales bacterium]